MPIEIRNLIVESESAESAEATGSTGSTRSGTEAGQIPTRPNASDAERMLGMLQQAAAVRHDRRRAD